MRVIYYYLMQLSARKASKCITQNVKNKTLLSLTTVNMWKSNHAIFESVLYFKWHIMACRGRHSVVDCVFLVDVVQ